MTPRTQFRPLTIEDYRQIPEGPPYFQLIEGDLIMSPSPDRFHQDVLGNLHFILRNYLEKHPVGSVHLAPSDVQLTEVNVYQPDLYYVSKARQRVLTVQGAAGSPSLVVEILSAKTAKLDRGVKRTVYARSGVEEMWIVDRETKRVEVYRFSESLDVPVGSYGLQQKFGSPLFPRLRINVRKVFEQ
jgi:Uma2 family endonuclease